jgi:hypothetical protein
VDVLQATLIIFGLMTIRFAIPIAILFAVGNWANRRFAYSYT